MSHKHGTLIALGASSPILMAFSEPTTQTGPLGLDWWAWILILAVVLVIVASVVGWWLSQRPEKPSTSAPPSKPTPPSPAKPPEVESGPAVADAAPAVAAAQPTPSPDDLKRIEGIGPKIASLLQEAGITTFAQLAETDTSRLVDILTQASLQRLANPETWPEQARLASAGDWDALEALQEDLKGGRRV